MSYEKDYEMPLYLKDGPGEESLVTTVQYGQRYILVRTMMKLTSKKIQISLLMVNATPSP